jgi:hypothetical protein
MLAHLFESVLTIASNALAEKNDTSAPHCRDKGCASFGFTEGQKPFGREIRQ